MIIVLVTSQEIFLLYFFTSKARCMNFYFPYSIQMWLLFYRNEHKLAVQKFQEEEKKKLEQTIKQIQLKLGEEIKKDIENTKTLLQKENAEKKSKLIRDIEKVNNEEIEKIKLGYVQDMKEKKELMQKEHEEVSCLQMYHSSDTEDSFLYFKYVNQCRIIIR